MHLKCIKGMAAAAERVTILKFGRERERERERERDRQRERGRKKVCRNVSRMSAVAGSLDPATGEYTHDFTGKRY